MTGGRPMPGESAPETPGARRTLGSYTSYADAQRVVDFLSDRRFPVERVSIVGRDLETVEQVTGRMTTGRAALTGAGQGALLGVFFALLLGIFFPLSGPYLGVLLYGVVLGVVLGAAFGALVHAATGGRRDFSTVGAVRAAHYDVLVEDEAAEEARRLLDEMDAGTGGPRERPGAAPRP